MGGRKGLLGSKDTDLLENFWAEPRQDLDTVFWKIMDCTLPLPMADHAEAAAQTGQVDLPSCRNQNVAGLDTPAGR